MRERWEKFIRLAMVLMRGRTEQADEYSKKQTETGLRMVLTAVALLALAGSVFYLGRAEANKTQFAAIFAALLTVFAVGQAYAYCLLGTLPFVDRYGGRLVWGFGALLMFFHCSMFLPTRYYFGGNLFFWDMGLLGVLLYYDACNGAWLCWEKYQETLDRAESREEKVKAKRVWIFKNLWPAAILAFVILFPAWLSWLVYSDSTMDQVKTEATAAEEGKKTPEYLEYERLWEEWTEPKEYGMVYRTTLKSQFSAEEEPGTEGGVLFIRTENEEMQIYFVPEGNGARILQASYLDLRTEDPNRAERLFVEGSWYAREEWMRLQGEPGFAAEQVDAYRFPGGPVSFPGAKGMEKIQETEEKGNRKLTFYVSKEYRDSVNRGVKALGVNTGEPLEDWQSLLLDRDGRAVEQEIRLVTETRRMKNGIPKKKTEVSWQKSRYLTRTPGQASELFSEYVKNGPKVPEEALRIYREMDEK